MGWGEILDFWRANKDRDVLSLPEEGTLEAHVW
jgi:hypothetical protein